MPAAPANDRLLRALCRLPVDATPVWLMRQAGRYLPEYRRVREQAGDFLTLCKTPELACEVSLQPLQRYPLDAAIVFSDILTIPDAMGLGLSFRENEGPCFARPVREQAQIAALRAPDPGQDLAYVMETIRLVRRELAGRVPLIGFSGSPWTLAAYMVEGRSSRDFPTIKRLMFDRPQWLERMLEVLTESVAAYLNAQVAAGADCVMIFDTWGGVLSGEGYRRFSLEPVRRVIAALRQHHDRPVILFTKGGGAWLEDMAESGCDALGLDWTAAIGDAKRRVGGRVALQGNLDPAALLASDEAIRLEARRILDDFGPGAGHIFNLGHGVLQQTDPDKVAVLVDEVHAART